MKKRALLVVMAAALGWAGAVASADSVLNIDLGLTPTGAAIPTNPTGYQTPPITAFGYVGGYSATSQTNFVAGQTNAPGYGTAVVSNVAGIGHAADLSTDSSNAEVGALYLDTTLNTSLANLTLSFDINVLAQATGGYGQVLSDGHALLFGVRLWSPTVSNWATTFNLSPTDATTGQIGFRDAGNSALQTFGTYTVGQAQHVDIQVDYPDGTANVYLNGNLAYAGYPLRGGAQGSPRTSEMFMYLNGTDGGTSNEVAVGNVQIAQTTPLPSVASMGAVMLGLAGVGVFVRARRKQQIA